LAAIGAQLQSLDLFGRSGCAEQSVVQETLDHATPANVTQMALALTTL
jgi:hypothetical protein